MNGLVSTEDRLMNDSGYFLSGWLSVDWEQVNEGQLTFSLSMAVVSTLYTLTMDSFDIDNLVLTGDRLTVVSRQNIFIILRIDRKG